MLQSHGPRAANDVMAFDGWAAKVQALCGALDAVPSHDRPFLGGIASRQAGDIEIVEHNVSVERLHWGSRHVAQARDPYCYLLVQMGGQVRVTQNGRDVVLAPGDCTIIDSLRPVEFHTDGHLNQLSFHLPRDFLASRTLDGDIPCALPIAGGSGAGAVLSGYARTLYEQARALSASDQRYRDSLLSLLLAALPGIPDRPGRARERQLQRIRQFIDERLHEPDLAPRTIADGLGISTRHLHRLFEETGQSMGEWMRQRRLERARAELGDPAHGARSILDIAFSWGFNDASHFSRSFRAAFGCAPRDYRRKALGNRE